MRNSFILLLLVISSYSVNAQNVVWHTDINKAVDLSNKTQKPMLLFFTGSDWCGWCIRLQKEVLKTAEFESWAKENVILVELDFPRRTPQSDEIKKQNMELQQMFQVRGYPTVWFVGVGKTDSKISLEKLGSTGYVAGGPSAWLTGANRILKK
ncbi:MAG: thioredoxin family protein [Flavobacterium sp.]|nr:thioredoxin family protein [Flavobacterium sp.]